MIVVLYDNEGAWYGPQDNPVERMWAALKNTIANDAM